jgi:hypothetical protein
VFDAIPTYESLSISKVKEAVYSYEEHPELRNRFKPKNGAGASPHR